MCAFARQSLTPECWVEPPTDLDRGKDLGKEHRHGESDVADRLLRRFEQGDPAAESALVPLGQLGVQEARRLVSRERPAVRELPNLGLGESLGEPIEVRLLESSKVHSSRAHRSKRCFDVRRTELRHEVQKVWFRDGRARFGRAGDEDRRVLSALRPVSVSAR